MMKVAKALYQFFSGFDIPAYDKNAVPDDATLPYITYETADTDWRQPMSIAATVWYHGTTYTELYQKVDEIRGEIGERYTMNMGDGEYVTIYKDSMNFAQEQDAADDNVKAMYLQFEVHAFCF